MNTEPSLISLIARVTRLYRMVLNELMTKHQIDLSSEMLGVLLELWKDDGLSHQELSQRIKKDKGGMTKLINSLESRNLVSRQPAPEDGRRKLVFLTQKGKYLCKKVQPIVNKLRKSILRDITPKQAEETQQILTQIITNLERKKH